MTELCVFGTLLDGLELLERLAAHRARASRSVTSSFAFSSAGMSLGRNGAASSGSSTSLDMLLMITAHALRGGGAHAELEQQQRRDGASGAAVTVCTNVVDAFALHALVLLVVDGGGDERGDERLDVLLSMDSQILLRHSRAATDTSS